MARVNPEVTVEVDWDGDGTYSHSLSDVSDAAEFRETHGTRTGSLWTRPAASSARGNLVLPERTYLPGKAGGVSKDDAQRRNRIRVRSTAGSTTTTLFEGFVSTPRVRRETVQWRVEGKLGRLLGEEGTIDQATFGATTLDDEVVDQVGALFGLAAGELDAPPTDAVGLAIFEESSGAGRLFSQYCQVSGSVPVETSVGDPKLGPRQPSVEPAHDADIASSTHRMTSLVTVEDTTQVRNRVVTLVRRLERREVEVNLSEDNPQFRFSYQHPDDVSGGDTQTHSRTRSHFIDAPLENEILHNVRVTWEIKDNAAFWILANQSDVDISTSLRADDGSGVSDPTVHLSQTLHANGGTLVEVFFSKTGQGPGDWLFPSDPVTSNVWWVPSVSDGVQSVLIDDVTVSYEYLNLLAPEGPVEEQDTETFAVPAPADDQVVTERLPNLWLPESTGPTDLQAHVNITAQPPVLHTVELPLAQETEAKSTEIAGLDAGQVIGFGAVDDARDVEVGEVCAVVSASTRIRQGRPPVRQLVLLELGHSWTPPAPPPPPPPPGPFGLASWAPPTGQVADVLALITAGSRAEPYREKQRDRRDRCWERPRA